MLAPSVFKAYDVRGIVPDELDAEGAYAIACGYVAAFEPKVMAVGRDMRLSSPEIAAAAIRGAADSGADVVDLGQIGTEMLYFAVGEYGYEGGLQVTASHNPAAYNGMKIVRRGALPVGGDTGLDKIKARALGDAPEPAGSPGRDLEARRLRRVPRPGARVHRRRRGAAAHVSFSTARTGWPGRWSRRSSSGSRSPSIPYSLEPDGHFPNHEPNPLLEENRTFIMGKVREHGADLGIAWDGDADRCFFIDDTGEFVPGDLITALIARSMLEKHPGLDDRLRPARVVGGARHRSPRPGGTALENRVGHAFIKARIRKEDAVFAGEVSGHYYFRDFYYCDTGVVPALVMLELLSQSPASRSRSSSRPSASATTSPARSTRRWTTCR